MDGQTDSWTDIKTDGRTDRRIDRQTDGRTNILTDGQRQTERVNHESLGLVILRPTQTKTQWETESDWIIGEARHDTHPLYHRLMTIHAGVSHIISPTSKPRWRFPSNQVGGSNETGNISPHPKLRPNISPTYPTWPHVDLYIRFPFASTPRSWSRKHWHEKRVPKVKLNTLDRLYWKAKQFL